jgi:hypothetical protein
MIDTGILTYGLVHSLRPGQSSTAILATLFKVEHLGLG